MIKEIKARKLIKILYNKSFFTIYTAKQIVFCNSTGFYAEFFAGNKHYLCGTKAEFYILYICIFEFVVKSFIAAVGSTLIFV